MYFVCNNLIQVLFIEPNDSAKLLGFLPGDYLTSVNHVDVQSMSYSKVVELIRNAGQVVHITVKSASEFFELSKRFMFGFSFLKPYELVCTRQHISNTGGFKKLANYFQNVS